MWPGNEALVVMADATFEASKSTMNDTVETKDTINDSNEKDYANNVASTNPRTEDEDFDYDYFSLREDHPGYDYLRVQRQNEKEQV